jgi:photosystem II stability/assembly factor-like uncharacterized protein
MKIYKANRVWNLFLVFLFVIGGALLITIIGESQGSAAPAQVYIEEPSLTPPYDNDQCTSYWYEFTNILDEKAYLTVNVKDTGPFNSAEWLAEIPVSGYYTVEAFIPAEFLLFWPCSINKEFDSNTSNANYTIDHRAGSTLVSLDQSSVNDDWVSLGEFYYKEGDLARVHLVDQTGEDRLTRTVAFSSVRFTWVSEPPDEQFIPLVFHRYGLKVHIADTWTTDLDGRQKSAFVPFEPMLINIQVDNHLENAVLANIKITSSGLCSETIVDEWALLETGETTFDFPRAAPPANCKGIYTMTSKVIYDGREVEQTLPYLVYVSLEQAFDKCNIGTIGQMQTWWALSPYMAANLYIGGVSRACGNLGLNAEWVSAVHQQGWQFIPTWVGPQAPCSRYFHKIPWSSTAAYERGVLEAELAYEAALELGFGPGTSIFNDIENYGPNASDTCRQAVSSYIDGWTERLHELGFRAGAYGGVCSSYMSDWMPGEEPWSPVNELDEVWIAHWNRPTYDPYAVVATTICLSNTYWSPNRRIKQYAGDHNETYGGVTFNIDSNVLDLPLSNVQGGFQALLDEDEVATITMNNSPYLGEFQLVSREQGWTISNGKLFWTDDAGLSWKAIDFPQAGDSPVFGAHFLDELRGLVFLFSGKTGQPLVLSTLSGPQGSWRAFSLDLPDYAREIHSAYFDFIDPKTGWLSLKLATGSNFSLGELFQTQDGGRTWDQLNLPIGGPVRFVSAEQGWVAGGPGGGELYETKDGGHSWQPVQLAAALSGTVGFKSMPVFLNSEEGVMTRTSSRPGDPVLEILRTRDGGKTWALENHYDLPDGSYLDAPALLTSSGEGYLLTLPSSDSRLSRIAGRIAPFSLLESGSLPAGATHLEFLDDTGWVRTSEGTCRGQKRGLGEALLQDTYWSCSLETKLWKTTDGGRTWLDVTP